MEKSTRESLLDAGLELLGRVGFRAWSMRGVEDEAEVPHGTARHYFSSQRGLMLAVVHHLLGGDQPRPGEQPREQIARWLGPEVNRTKARYELIVASFHDDELAQELSKARDQFVGALIDLGIEPRNADEMVVSLDGLTLDALLRRLPPDTVNPDSIIARYRPQL
ncbi:TetR family transcriptional regulator [Rhodococcus sp. CUA-806]|nr:TetR family transcriptional regulator [Rhodococcus sp. CUA-806]